MPISSTQAIAALPAAGHPNPRELSGGGRMRVLVVIAVVEMVSVQVPADAPVMLTGVVAPKLKVGRLVAPVGLVARAAVKATLPVKPPLGVTLTVDVFPVVAPGATLTAVPLRVKLGGTAAETITFTTEEVEAAKLELPS